MDEERGVPEVPNFNEVYEQAILLATTMRKDVIDFYKYYSNHETACHMRHIKGKYGALQVRSGIVIQKDIRKMPFLHANILSFLWIYNHCILKKANEVVVEGMCRRISKHADSIRGLSFGRYVVILMP